MSYESVSLKSELSIENLYSIHYFEYMSTFTFPGESHDFWELLFVDKGEVQIQAGEKSHLLRKGDIIFHKPNEFHSVSANGKVAPNLVVVSFACNAPCMSFFEDKILTISETEHNYLGIIVHEAGKAFEGRLDDPYQTKLIKSENVPFGSEQLIKNYLELFLISILRRQDQKPVHTSLKFTAHNADNEVYHKVIQYMEDHLNDFISIEQLCKDTLVGRSKVQNIFRDRHHCGVINYFSMMKIDMAKQLIRNNNMNFTQVSECLGYTSIHYFSRQFKKITGMTPSEYSSSIKGLSETNL